VLDGLPVARCKNVQTLVFIAAVVAAVALLLA
jgi:hypothetical protein